MGNVTITITSKNGTKQTFDAIATDANAMAGSIEQAGARSSANFEKIGNAVGKTALAFGAFTLIATKIAGDAEASSARLQTSFQDAGLAVTDYQDQINQLTSQGLKLAFDDEDVQDALSKLIGVTKNAAQSFDDLQLAEDIARGQGVSLAEATQTVVSVEAGRFRGLAQLGIALDATSTKQDYLAKLQEKYSGQATAYATTGAANFERWKNSAENALESVGGKLEGLQLPILALSTTATALGPLTKAFKDLSNVGELGGALSQVGGFAAAMGPAGLAGAALAAGAGVLYLATQTQDYNDVANAAAISTLNLTNFFKSLASTLDPVQAEKLLLFMNQTNAVIDDAAKRQTDLNNISELQIDMQGRQATALDLTNQTVVEATQAYFGLTAEQLMFLDSNHDLTLSIGEVDAAVALYQANLDRLNAGQLEAVQADVINLFSHTEINRDKAMISVKQLEDELQTGTITGEQFANQVHELALNFSQFIDPVNAATAAVTAHTTAITDTQAAIQSQIAMYGASGSVIASYAESQRTGADATKASTSAIADDTAVRIANSDAIIGQMNTYADQNQSLQAHTKIWVDMVTWANAWQAASDFSKSSSSLNLVSDAVGALDVSTKNAAPDTKEYSTYLDEQAQSAANAAKAIDDYRSRLQEVHMVVNDGANQFAKHATVAGNALDAGFRVAVGNTNAIASQSQGVEDWADKLIGVRGTIAEIDTLLAKGVITADEYNRAQSAETSILHNNAAIQRDVLKIQTDQAPLLARLTKQERDYMDELAKQPAQQQLVTLGYMDQAESAKALAAEQLALSAVSGELGKTGVDTANKMITAAAEADPVLAAMLQDMGLITLGADGTVTVHFESVDGAKSSTDKLIGAVRHMSSDLEKLIKILIDDSEVGFADGKVNDLKEHVDNLDGSSATVTVGADTSDYYKAIAGIGLGQIIGDAFVHVGAIVDPSVSGTSSGEPPIGGTGGQSSLGFNGGVMGYAAGGAVSAMLAEYGGELVHLAGGGAAYARHKGLYDLPRGSYVDTAPMSRQLMPLGGDSFHFDFSGANFGGNKDEIVRAVSDAIVMAANRHFAGHGVRG